MDKNFFGGLSGSLTLCLNWVIELVVLMQRNSALRNEELAYLISELVTCLDAVCLPLLAEETAIK